MSSGTDNSKTENAAYAAARSKLLTCKAADLGVTSQPDGPDVWGVLIDYPTDVAICTLVALADGTVNLLLSNGPAIVGAGQHPEVALAAQQMLSHAEAMHSHLKPTPDLSLPTDDHAHIYLLTSSGVVGEIATDDDSGHTQRQLAELGRQGDAIVTTIRNRFQSSSAPSPRPTAKDNFLQAKIVAGTLVVGAAAGAVATQTGLLEIPLGAGVFLGCMLGLMAGFLLSGLMLIPQFTAKDNLLQAIIVAGTVIVGAVAGAAATRTGWLEIPLGAGVFLGGTLGLMVGLLGSGLLLMLIKSSRG